MLTQDYRSKTFDQLYGQDFCVEVIRSIIRNPRNSPRSLIMYGPYGTGKTSASRLLAKGLNCKSHSDKKPCGVCEICQSDLSYTPFYQEFDSGDVGNAEAIRNMKETVFLSSTLCDYRVIVLDEAHLISRTAQGVLLKTLEDCPENVFVVFPTTDVQNILGTVRSRSIELNFRVLTPEEIILNLRRIAKSESLQVSEEILYYIAVTSKGHARDSVMLLDLYAMMEDKTKFFGSVRSAESKVLDFLISVKEGNDQTVLDCIKIVASCMIENVRYDLYSIVNNMIQAVSSGKVVSSYFKEKYEKVVELYKQDSFKLFSFLMQDWAVNSFKEDTTMQALLWLIYNSFRFVSGEVGSKASGSMNSLVERNRGLTK